MSEAKLSIWAGRHERAAAGLASRVWPVLVLALLAPPRPGAAQQAVGAAAAGRRVTGVVLDSISAEPVAGATARIIDARSGRPVAGQLTDSDGSFVLDWRAAMACSLHVEAFGYQPWSATFPVASDPPAPLRIRLVPAPLTMDEVLVRGRSAGAPSGPSFVETLALDESRVGLDLGAVLDHAVGVHTKSSGGLGSFSTVSVRGSTAEQVQIYLDGVPLNQAIGGGVDLGELPVTGIESVEVYRGAVPGRFGGNSIGGVIHIRTRGPEARQRARVQALGGTWGTRAASASATGGWGGTRRYLALVELAQSRNDFRFRDDNGTEYNPDDDETARRRNNDFRNARLLAKLDQRLGQTRLQVRSTAEIRQQGIPSVSNNQSLHARLDKWRTSNELELFGAMPAWNAGGFRLNAYHLVQEYEYRDLEGTVGVGYQHERNRTSGAGGRAELDWVVGGALVTLFASGGSERFEPHDLLRPQSVLLPSRRRSVTGGWEGELEMRGSRLRLSAGSQWQLLDDRFYGNALAVGQPTTLVRRRTETVAGGRVGAQADLGHGLQLKGHRGWHCRPPNFYELFGDRGAVKGNPALHNESGRNWDAGLAWTAPRRDLRGRLLELVYFDNTAADLIRFVQNAQRVSIAYNIGDSRVRGLECRARLAPWRGVQIDGNYTYQVPENLTEAAYEHGNDLPNAPRHAANARIAWGPDPWRCAYEFSHESRHFLDRANLRSVPARSIHGIEVQYCWRRRVEIGAQIRNLTDNQVADLWGYPLPGRSAFVSLAWNLGPGTAPGS